MFLSLLFSSSSPTLQTALENCTIVISTTFSPDTPYCSVNQKSDFELPIYGQADIKCHVESDPSEVTFYWEFNSTQTLSDESLIDSDNMDENILSNAQQYHDPELQHQPLMSIHNSGRTSHLTFSPRAESDFGTLFCYATNRLGRQRNPCVFHVRRSSKFFYEFRFDSGIFCNCLICNRLNIETPHPPRNCTVIEALKTNQTTTNTKTETVTVQCVINPEDDALFNLEVFTESGSLLANITSRNAHFEINHEQLRRGRSLLVYARNINGASVRVDITANITVAGEPRKLGLFNAHSLKFLSPLSIILFYVVCFYVNNIQST